MEMAGFSQRSLLAGILLACRVGSAQTSSSSDSAKLDQLVAQLEGKGSAFAAQPGPRPECRRAGWLEWFLRREIEIIRDAAHCLGEMGPAARPAVPALIEAVRNGPNNFDTGDGTILVRDAIVEALGRTQDLRAVPVLIEALEHPKPMDLDYGALPSGPVGEEAALRALGHMGPLAVSAVPHILPYLRHRTIAHNQPVVQAAATALGLIGDASAIPALVETLSGPAAVSQVAEALGRFGPAARTALPRLRRLLEENAERNGEAQLRKAIASIGGPQAAMGLPKTFQTILHDAVRSAREIAERSGTRTRATHIDGQKEEFTMEFRNGVGLRVILRHERWKTDRRAEGTLTVRIDGQEGRQQAFGNFGELEKLLTRAIGGGK